MIVKWIQFQQLSNFKKKDIFDIGSKVEVLLEKRLLWKSSTRLRRLTDYRGLVFSSIPFPRTSRRLTTQSPLLVSLHFQDTAPKPMMNGCCMTPWLPFFSTLTTLGSLVHMPKILQGSTTIGGPITSDNKRGETIWQACWGLAGRCLALSRNSNCLVNSWCARWHISNGRMDCNSQSEIWKSTRGPWPQPFSVEEKKEAGLNGDTPPHILHLYLYWLHLLLSVR